MYFLRRICLCSYINIFIQMISNVPTRIYTNRHGPIKKRNTPMEIMAGTYIPPIYYIREYNDMREVCYVR